MIANICIHFLSQCTSEVYRTVISRIETEIIRKENAIGCIIRDRLSFTRNKQVFDFLNRVFIKGLAEYRVFSKGALLCALLFDLNNSVEGSVNSFFHITHNAGGAKHHMVIRHSKFLLQREKMNSVTFASVLFGSGLKFHLAHDFRSTKYLLQKHI